MHYGFFCFTIDFVHESFVIHVIVGEYTTVGVEKKTYKSMEMTTYKDALNIQHTDPIFK